LEEISCATAKFGVMYALAKETLAPAKRSRHATSTNHTLPRAHVIASKISDLWGAKKSHRRFQANSRLTADAQHYLKSVQWIPLSNVEPVSVHQRQTLSNVKNKRMEPFANVKKSHFVKLELQ
jgi:hypothetical protein